MHKELLHQSPLLALPLFALLLFVAVFALILVRTMKRRAKDYDGAAALPFAPEKDDE